MKHSMEFRYLYRIDEHIFNVDRKITNDYYRDGKQRKG